MKRYKFIFTVPTTYAHQVKEAIFSAGAGKIGAYERCCFEYLGTGRFRPMDGASPAIGEIDVDQSVPELCVEVLCEGRDMRAILSAFRSSHPYEEPAFDIFECVDPDIFN